MTQSEATCWLPAHYFQGPQMMPTPGSQANLRFAPAQVSAEVIQPQLLFSSSVMRHYNQGNL